MSPKGEEAYGYAGVPMSARGAKRPNRQIDVNQHLQ